MLHIKHKKDTKETRHLYTDVSFVLASKGFTSIMCYDDSYAKTLAGYLAGRKDMNDYYLYHNGNRIDFNNQEMLDNYRNSIVYAVFEEFYIFEECRVIDNITLRYDYPSDKLRILLNRLQLLEVQYELVSDISFEQRVKVALARILLRGYEMIVFYPNSTLFSDSERKVLYDCMKTISDDIAIITIEDKLAFNYATRKIEFRNKRIVSDSKPKYNNESVSKPVTNMLSDLSYRALFNEVKRNYRWFYRFLFILLLSIMSVTSILTATTAIDLIDIQSSMIEHNELHTTLVKHLENMNGEYYSQYYDNFTIDEINELEKELNGHLTSEYGIIDPQYASAYLDGYYSNSIDDFPINNHFHVVEINDESLIKPYLIEGRIPENDGEVIVTKSDMMEKIEFCNDEDSKIGSSFYWYGYKVKVVGILREQEEFHNNIYVVPGFMEQHPLNQMRVFPKSEKELIINENIYPLLDIRSNKRLFYYYDGKMLNYENNLNDNQGVLDYQSALVLGFESHIDVVDLTSYLNACEEYLKFISPYIGNKMHVNAYLINEDRLNTMIYQKELEIAGFEMPTFGMFKEDYDNNGSVYVSQNSIVSYLVKNIEITNVQYSNSNKSSISYDLQYLNDNKKYDASMMNSTLLNLLVIDFKSLSMFLSITLIIVLVIALIFYIFLLHKSSKRSETRFSLYYTMGENKDKLTNRYQSFFLTKVKKYFVVATIISLFIQLFYVIIIVVMLHGSIKYLWFLLLPCLIAIVIYSIFAILTKLWMKIHPIVVDYIGDD